VLKKSLAFATTTLLAIALAVGVASPASAYDAGSPPTGQDANHESNWVWAPGEVCVKDDKSRTVPSYTVPAPSSGWVYTKIILKAGSVHDDSNTVFNQPVAGQVLTTADNKDISHIISCSLPANVVDCSIVKLVEGRSLNGSDHINMDVVQGGTTFQINIDIDDVQQQDNIVTPTGLVVRMKVNGVQVLVRAVTVDEKTSGVISLTYGTYLTGTWTVEWVQFSDTGRYFNQDRVAANFIKCGTALPNAAASVTLVPPTCTTDGYLTLNTPAWATWGSSAPGVGPYSVVATAQDGHTFPADNTPGQAITNGGKTKTFTGTIVAKSDQAADCDKYEVALYLYQKKDPTQPASWPNSLKQTFIASHKGTAWFTTFPTGLPDYVCGPAWGVQQDKVGNWTPQWDDNGNFTWPTNIEYPTDNIGWPPIYDAKHDNLSTVITVPACDTPTGEPKFEYKTCQQGSQNLVTLDAVKGGEWSIEQNGVVTEYDTYTGTPAGFAEYTITLSDKDPLDKYDVTTKTWKYTAVDPSTLKCATAEDPTWAEQVCNPAGIGFTTASYTITPATGIRYEISVNGATPVDATPPGNLPVTTPVTTFPTTIVIKAFPLAGYELVGSSEFTHQFLASTDDCIDKDASAKIVYIDPTCLAPGAIDVPNSTLVNASWKAALPTVPGDYTVVAKADTGHAFPDGTTEKSFAVTIAPKSTAKICDPPTLAIVTPTFSQTPLSCTAVGSYTLSAVDPGTIDWSVNGGPLTTGGTFPVSTAQSIQLVATPHDPADGLDPAWTYNNSSNILTLTFAAPTTTCDLTTLAFTGTGKSIQLTLVALLFVLAGLGFYFAHRRIIANR
jgi:hypothetical protein